MRAIRWIPRTTLWGLTLLAAAFASTLPRIGSWPLPTGLGGVFGDALLQVPAKSPLLSVERVAYTYNDVPMELRRGLYRTDTHHYRNELS